jgi:hypothetical protein
MGRASLVTPGQELGEIRRTQTLTEILGPLIWINGPASEEQTMPVDARRAASKSGELQAAQHGRPFFFDPLRFL